MEEKCSDAIDSKALDFENSSSTSLPTSKDVTEVQGLLLHQPSTSRSSMSLLQDDFANSQQDFAAVLDDETTTSGMLGTFEISSSNSLPTCSDPSGTVAVDDNSSTDTIKLVAISNPESCNNEFFNASEVYVINDDDDDDLDDVVESGAHVNTSQISAGASELGGQMNGVIVTTSGATIYLETPVVDDQQHPQMMGMVGQLDFAEKAGKPKRLSDEFLLVEGPGPLLSGVPEGVSKNICSTLGAERSITGNYNFDGTESPLVEKKSDSGVDGNAELQHDRMSFRLKKMNINNAAAQEASVHAAAFNELPSSSLGQLVPTLTDIESMDLIERRDFETEQKLTGGVILKASSLVTRNMLSLSLIKPCIEQKDGLQQGQQDVIHDGPSSSTVESRVVSSDSKCAYKDPTDTPTSSRNYSSRLAKSTAQLNLCSIVSHPPNEQPQKQSQQTKTTKTQHQKPNNSNSSVSSSTSVIVNDLSTSANVPNSIGGAGGEIFSNSNSNDSLIGGNTASTTTNCQQNELEQPEREQENLLSFDRENSCSRTSVLQPLLEAECQPAELDDAQPSTSSARCQYPPLKSLRQVHASAQTNERYLSRVVSSASSSTAFGASAHSSTNSVTSSGAAGINLSTTSRSRRRADSTPHLNRNTSDDVVTVFKIVVENGGPPPELADFNDDPWADCDELNSDMEEICTCHHSSTESSLGGSNTSLNDTDDLDSYGGGAKEGDLSNFIQMVSISEEFSAASPNCTIVSFAGNGQQRKRKYNDGRLVDGDPNSSMNCGGFGDANNRKRIAYDCLSTPRPSQSSCAPLIPSTPTTQLALSSTGSPHGRRTPRSVIPTRDNPPPELQNWLTQFQRWSHAERLLAVDRLIEHCEPTQVRHMMKVIEPQFQRDFISLLPRELALQVLAYLEPKDLLRAAQTCRSWRFLCDDNLLWREKCRKAQIVTESRTDRPKRGRAGNMPPIASPWKAAYMRQHIIEMNWRSRPIREPKVLKGHDDHVITCLQFSGNRIVSGSDDNTLKVWSAVTGRCLRTLIGHTGGVWSSQMSGNIIISGSTDRTLKVWDMDTGHCVHTLLGHTSTVRCMHLNGNKVVSGSRDATLRVWDIEQGTCLHVLVGHLAAVRCVQYDGKLIVSGAYDYMVKIWHPERQECLHTLQGHTNRVYSLQFDGIHVVSGSLDTSIRVWDVETGNCKHTLMGHQSLTSGMELRQNILVSGNADSTVKVWDITTGQCLQTLSGPNKHQSAVTCLQFNSRFVVTSSDDGTVKLWDVKTGDFIRNLVALDSGGSGGVVWRIRANDTKLICAVGSRNGTEETKLMVLDFDVEGACVKCS